MKLKIPFEVEIDDACFESAVENGNKEKSRFCKGDLLQRLQMVW